MATIVAFVVGEKFTSFDDLEKKISEYTRRNYIDLHRGQCRTISAAIKSKRISQEKVKNDASNFKKCSQRPVTLALFYEII